MRIAALAVAAMLFAGQAWATVHNVTNDTNLATAMGAGGAQPGDVVNIAAGSYTGSFVPANSGTAGNPIRIVGSQSAPQTVSTTDGLDWADGATRRYISWTGIKVSDDVAWFRAVGCSLTYAKVDSGGLMLHGTSTAMESFGESRGNYIGNCTFRQNVGANYVMWFTQTNATTVERCRFYGAARAADGESGRGRYLFRSQGNTIKDCSMEMDAWGTTSVEQQAVGLRDSTRFNLFLRDTLLLGMTSKASRRVLLSQSGSYPGTTGYNSFVDCYYKAFSVSDGQASCSFEFQDNTNGGLIQGCQFISRVNTAMQWSGSGLPDSMVVRHNTFYSGGSQAFRYSPDANTTTPRFNGNAYVSRTAGSCDTDLNNYHLQTLGAFGQSDSNAFYMADSSVAFGKRNGGASETCYTPAAWRTATSNDLASSSFVLGAGVVTDTTWATLDLTPASGSSLVSVLFPDGYAGAFDEEAPAPDPPATGGTDADDWFYTRREDL